MCGQPNQLGKTAIKPTKLFKWQWQGWQQQQWQHMEQQGRGVAQQCSGGGGRAVADHVTWQGISKMMAAVAAATADHVAQQGSAVATEKQKTMARQQQQQSEDHCPACVPLF